MTKELQPRILVFGVGGAGGNAVNNMIEAKLQGVEFIVANTDAQALGRAKTDKRIQLGIETTEGLGAGARPEVGAAAAEESISQVEEMLEGAHMVFIAAGMGGGTGTGAAPVIAKAARDRGILTVGVVTKPFAFEGNRRMDVAEQGLREISRYVDTMIVVPNQNLFRVANESTTFADAFRMADDVLYAGVRGITDLMVMPGLINLDFADVRATMSGMGSAMMGMGEAEGENRALEAARRAIENPLLDDVSLTGAQGVLINITGGYDMTLFELDEAANEVRAEVDQNATIILGSTFDQELEGKIRVSVVAAGLAGQVIGIEDEPEEVEAAEEIAVPQEIAPVVVANTPLVAPGTDVEATEPEPDLREDFAGRTLPAAEAAGSDGDDQVAADLAFAKKPPLDAAKEPASAEPSAPAAAGFSNLFGWRKGGETPSDKGDADAIISSPEQHPEPADFDDADLEIPAFLRRSANH